MDWFCLTTVLEHRTGNLLERETPDSASQAVRIDYYPVQLSLIMSLFKIPSFYRILIVDDQIASSCNSSLQEFFNNILVTMIWQAWESPEIEIETEVVLTSSPKECLNLWEKEIFNLTLIDANLTETKDIKDSPLENLLFASNHQGLNILKLLDGFVTTDDRFLHRKEMCRFFLWSGMYDKDDDSTIKRQFKDFSLDEQKYQEYFISKHPEWKNYNNQTGLEIIQRNITEGIKHIKEGDYPWKHKVERLFFSVLKNYAGIAERLSGGCLIFDNKDNFPFLDEIGMNSTDKIRVMPGRIPDSLLSDSTDTTFLPINFSAGQNISFHEIEQKNINQETVEKLIHRRNISSPDRLPVYPRNIQQQEGADGVELLGQYKIKNHYIAAATPLTGISVIGLQQAVESLKNKVIALLNGPFGAVVLKTVYLDKTDQWEGVHWPSIQAQSHMRSRCLYPGATKNIKTLWNTGRTALEMLPPSSLHELLVQLHAALKNNTHRVIVSLGSKFFQNAGSSVNLYWNRNYSLAQEEIWNQLFSRVFQDDLQGCFPLVEINVRHFLREIVIKYLGGDEYLNPVDFSQEVKLHTNDYWHDFKIWLQSVHNVAVKHKKKLIMKLPHRSDTLAYVQCICSLRKFHEKTAPSGDKEFGVRAMTLVNALKSPVPMGNLEHIEKKKKYSREWYAHPWAWNDAGDKAFKYQMSGAHVAPYRNQILAGLEPSMAELAQLDMEILLSGGITDKNSIRQLEDWQEYLQKMTPGGKKIISAIQIGTWALLQTEMNKKSWRE